MPSLQDDCVIKPLQPDEDAAAFRTLNEAWITRFFELEEADRKTLADPRGTILEKGGLILLAYAADQTVGCVALIPMEGGVYELSKMAVAPEFQGRGIGRALLIRAIDEARSRGARSLFLGSSTKLGNAVRLYESVGFRHVPPEQLPPSPYRRADVFMEFSL